MKSILVWNCYNLKNSSNSYNSKKLSCNLTLSKLCTIANCDFMKLHTYIIWTLNFVSNLGEVDPLFIWKRLTTPWNFCPEKGIETGQEFHNQERVDNTKININWPSKQYAASLKNSKKFMQKNPTVYQKLVIFQDCFHDYHYYYCSSLNFHHFLLYTLNCNW